MSDSNTLFNQEEARIKKYEQLSGEKFTESLTDLAYREMNSRYVDLEQKTLDSKQRSEKKRHLLSRKKEIEAQWVENTGGRAASLTLRLETASPKTKEYYSKYTMDEMEVLLKHNERGGNSTLYNDVVTDLELYNVAKDNVKDDADQVDLLRRIKSSCDAYISSRHPISSSGKVRKAMISRLADQVQEELAKYGDLSLFPQETEKQVTAETQVKSQTKTKVNASSVLHNAYRLFDSLKSDSSDQEVYAATQAHFELMSQYLQGEIKLSEADVAKLDDNMAQLCAKVRDMPIDPDQNDTMTSRFFNALGWTSRKPEVVSEYEFEDAVQESKLHTRMYHCIQAISGDPESGINMAKQLISDQGQKQYMSDGMYGKGTYLAVDVGKPDYTCEDVSRHCWTNYGQTEGSVQFTLCFNEKAKSVDEMPLQNMIRGKFKKDFAKVFDILSLSEKQGRRHGQAHLSMFAAFFGYNVIKGSFGVGSFGDPKADYYVAIDRSVLTISDTVEIRDSADSHFTPQQRTLRRED